MLEISPRITYSPEGVLELRKTTNGQVSESFNRRLESLDALPGYEVGEVEADTILHVEMRKVIKASKDPYRNEHIIDVFNRIKPFTHFSYEDPRDGVFCVEFWSADYGAKGIVYPQFQRWLNTNRITEELAKRCIEAMALPFGSTGRKLALKEFQYRANDRGVAAGLGGFTFGVASHKDTFGVTVETDTGYRNGEVEWNSLHLSTIGSCACWGATGDDRSDVMIHRGTTRLYELSPHNTDFIVQSLGMVLAAATLAYEAVRYPGTEDILQNAEWREPRR